MFSWAAITELHTRIFTAHLRSGWPVRSPGPLRWFCSGVGWRAERPPCLWRQEFRRFLQYFPRCSVALQRASASRLIHQTLGWGERKRRNISETCQITASPVSNLVMTWSGGRCDSRLHSEGTFQLLQHQFAVPHIHNRVLYCRHIGQWFTWGTSNSDSVWREVVFFVIGAKEWTGFHS